MSWFATSNIEKLIRLPSKRDFIYDTCQILYDCQESDEDVFWIAILESGEYIELEQIERTTTLPVEFTCLEMNFSTHTK